MEHVINVAFYIFSIFIFLHWMAVSRLPYYNPFNGPYISLFFFQAFYGYGLNLFGLGLISFGLQINFKIKLDYIFSLKINSVYYSGPYLIFITVGIS